METGAGDLSVFEAWDGLKIHPAEAVYLKIKKPVGGSGVGHVGFGLGTVRRGVGVLGRMGNFALRKGHEINALELQLHLFPKRFAP